MVKPQQVLTPEGWIVFQSLDLPAITQDFYLAGGTALALHQIIQAVEWDVLKEPFQQEVRQIGRQYYRLDDQDEDRAGRRD